MSRKEIETYIEEQRRELENARKYLSPFAVMAREINVRSGEAALIELDHGVAN